MSFSKTLALYILLCFHVAVLAQQSIGIKVNGGLSKVSDKLYDPYLTSQTVYFRPSGQAGLFYNLSVRAHEVFGIELLFSQIEGKEQTVDTVGTAFNSNGTTTRLLSTYTVSKHISYLSLPIYYGIQVKKFTFNIGVQVSARLMGSAETMTQTNYSFNAAYFLTPGTTYYNTNRLHMKDADFGETMRIVYRITNKFSVEGNYYYGLNNIYPNKARTTQWKNQQMTLGLRYSFLTVGKKEGKS